MAARFLAISVIAPALTLACSGGHSSNSNPTPIVAPTYTPYPLADYTIDDPACQTSAASSVAVTSSGIHAWDGPTVKTATAHYHDAASTTSLTTPAFTATTYNEVFSRECDKSLPAGHECDDASGEQKGWSLDNTIAGGGLLRICQDGHSYARLSYEGVGLTAAYFVQQARDHYLALTSGTAKAPEALTLRVLPQFVSNYDNATVDAQAVREQLFFVHNLAYFPVGQMIAVFPERADVSAASPGYFWESQFVLAHEYGHHIDFTRHGQVLTNIGLRWNPALHNYDDLLAQAQGMAGPSARGQLAGAIAEGFADMMAYYEGGASNRTLIGIPDLGFNRDPGNGTFYGGDPKILTNEHAAELFGDLEQTDLVDGGPVYADIHTIGAIISHTADAVFQTLTAANPGLANGASDEVDARYRLTLAFMDEIVAEMANITPDQTGNGVLAPLGGALAKVTNDYLGSFTLTGGPGAADSVRTAICQLVSDRLPALLAQPFARGGGC